MTLYRMLRLRCAAPLAATVLLGLATSAQETAAPALGGRTPEQEEMVRLFHEVERALQAIDLELADAGAGRIPLPEGSESGIERLLRSHGEKSSQATLGIEEILRLAQQMNQKSVGQCMKPGQSGQSPLDQQQQSAPKQQENTPDKPENGPEQPKPEGQKQEPQGQKPEDGKQSPPAQENRNQPDRAHEAGDAVPHGNDAERWGSLPERVPHVFQNQLTDDLPLQYRDWIDGYYRRLNKVR